MRSRRPVAGRQLPLTIDAPLTIVPSTGIADGAWVTVWSNTAHADERVLEFAQANMATTSAVFDIALGAAGSEVIIAEKIGIATSGTKITGPLRIPGLTRVAFRQVAAQGYTGYVSFAHRSVAAHRSRGVDISRIPRSLTRIGSASLAGNTDVTQAGTAWVEVSPNIGASPLLVVAMVAIQNGSGVGAGVIQFGHGPAGSEIAAGSQELAASSIPFWVPVMLASPVLIPAGRRLVARRVTGFDGAFLYSTFTVDPRTPGFSLR